jgi:hypothetical protein
VKLTIKLPGQKKKEPLTSPRRSVTFSVT